jgi:ribonuclease J
VEKPDFLTRGFVAGEVDFDELVPLLERSLAEAATEGVGEAHDLEERIRRAASRWMQRRYRRTPLIIPVVIDA